jgi:glucosamine--fructose-6-phosphate aminotransferase (isomerizing)
MPLNRLESIHRCWRKSLRSAHGHLASLKAAAPTRIYFGRHPAGLPAGALILFPLRQTVFGCGIAGLVAFTRAAKPPASASGEDLAALTERVVANGLQTPPAAGVTLAETYLGGNEGIEALWRQVQALKRAESFAGLYGDERVQSGLAQVADSLEDFQRAETKRFEERLGRMSAADAAAAGQRIERLRDIAWGLRAEILANIEKVRGLLAAYGATPAPAAVKVFRAINAVLNSIDRMEVRGRDSAGLSLLFVLEAAEFEQCSALLGRQGLDAELAQRLSAEPLLNQGISIHRSQGTVAVALTYKVAAEIGSLGDNISFLRREIAADPILHALAACAAVAPTVNAHTRWASVGAITEANCHPVDNRTQAGADANGIIHACLNGDIDNFLELKASFEQNGGLIHPEVTTDTKMIPLRIEHHLKNGYGILDAFLLAVNDFEGSHAIAMHTDLAPGKLFLAQRGSGQALFVGIADDHYMATSEVYGFIEETQKFIKLDGESVFEGKNGRTQGQVFVLDQRSPGGLEGISAMRYDGSPLPLTPQGIRHTTLTSRDIDRQDYPHYFLKEISEAPDSVAKTLQGRWKIEENGGSRLTTALDAQAVPEAVNQALADGRIKRIYFIGQGTAGVAALACANILHHYLNDSATQIQALKASEFSGFTIGAQADPDAMADALVIAISQSGTTTDTNRSVDLVRERGARTLAIVNRRDSDLTFKVDGVVYTSSGRDIEMSVASTKAFYAQIIAGALLGLHIARLKKRRDPSFVSQELERLLAVPGHMRRVLSMADRIQASATRLAVTKTYWATVGSGPNKASADEIRIKLSELCYKTISSDFVEDKKHIDLSSEPLILVCAAGARPTVIGDIIKDTAIFKAHKATPVVICDQGEERFGPYAADVFHVPVAGEHLAPILNTLVGHLWGYYAALSIHEGSRFLYRFNEDIRQTVSAASGTDIYELVLGREFREKIVAFDTEFRRLRTRKRFPLTVGYDATSDLTLLLKYLAGRLPGSDFELDFGLKGTAANMVQVLFNRLAEAIGLLARPVDAIKHQAKTVTVGTSRISERLEGILFAALAAENFSVAQMTPANVVVLKNMQAIIREIQGSVLYRISGLSLLGEPEESTVIEVLNKRGKTSAIPSRVETDNRLKGSKRTIVRQGNVYVGKGRKDDRSIAVIPLLSSSPARASSIEHLLLLHIAFKSDVPLEVKIRALGGKYEHIQNIVQENSIAWEDALLDLVDIGELFGRSAEKVAEFIVAEKKQP